MDGPKRNMAQQLTSSNAWGCYHPHTIPSAQSPVMSTQSDSAFSTALQQFKDGLDHAEKQSFKLVKFEDLLREISNLQARLLRQRRGKNLARLRPFLEAIDQLGKVVEVFANSSEFVAFVWVRDLALQQNLIAQYLRTRADY